MYLFNPIYTSRRHFNSSPPINTAPHEVRARAFGTLIRKKLHNDIHSYSKYYHIGIKRLLRIPNQRNQMYKFSLNLLKGSGRGMDNVDIKSY